MIAAAAAAQPKFTSEGSLAAVQQDELMSNIHDLKSVLSSLPPGDGTMPLRPVALGQFVQAAVARMSPAHNSLHIQPNHEEAILILEGSGVFQVGAERRGVGPGDFIFVPRGATHGFVEFRSEAIAFLSLMTPQIDLARDVLPAEGAGAGILPAEAIN